MMRRECGDSPASTSTTTAAGSARASTTSTPSKLSLGRACAIVGVSALVGGAVSSVYWGSTPLMLGDERTLRRPSIAGLGEGAYAKKFDSTMFVDEKHEKDFAARQNAPLRTRVSILVNEFSGDDVQVAKNTAGTVVSKFMKFRHMNEQGVAKFVHFERAVVPLYWPKTLDLALEAVKVFNLDETNNAAWIGVANRVEKTASKRVPEAWSHYPMHHHLGCLYSHLRLWHNVKRDNLQSMIVLESDGAFHASVDVLDFQNIIDNAPKDFDVIFL